MKTAIVTDSNSGITQDEGKELGIFVVPMPVLIDGEIYFEDINLSQEEFYKKLKSNASVSTSQPNPIDVADLWDSILKTYDEIVFIPMSSSLSETCHTLQHFVKNEKRFDGKVFVVDNQRISITQRQSVYDAANMVKNGMHAKDIFDWLMATKFKSSIYIMVDTLEYLKKGGRLTPAAALLGKILKIKPVLQIQGAKLDKYAQVRKVVDAKSTMINAIKKDLDTRFKDLVDNDKITLSVAYTDNFEEAKKFKEEIESAFPDIQIAFVDPLSLSVSCHIGPGALAVACAVKY